MTINEFHSDIDNVKQVSISFLDYVEDSSNLEDIRDKPEWQTLIAPYQSKKVNMYCLNDEIVIQAIPINGDKFTNNDKLYLDSFLTNLTSYNKADHYLLFYDLTDDPKFVLVRDDDQMKETNKDDYLKWSKLKSK